MYCSSCGHQNADDDKFCSECGERLSENKSAESSGEESEDNNNKGRCQKCNSLISENADKCPNCGYEPSNPGIFGGIIYTISILAVAFFALMLMLVWVVALATDFGFGDAVTLTIFFGVLGAIPTAIVALGARAADKKPVASD